MTDFYSQVDQNGKTGQPGQVKSYDCGYITTSNAELEAKEAGYNSLEEYLRTWWDEVSPELPFTWETLGGGYGFHGTTIFTNQEPDGGTLRCKEIFDQIMFDVYPPEEQPQADEPISISDGDIREMITRGAQRILESMFEGSKRTGTSYGDCSWCPFSEDDQICAQNGLTDEVAEELAAQGVVPAELVNRDFDIQASCSCERGTDPDSGPYDNCGDKSYYGEYDEAVALINQVTDERIKQVLMDSLNAACEEIECGRFEDYEPDPDFQNDLRRDMGEDRYVKPPFEAPMPQEPQKQWGGDMMENTPGGKVDNSITDNHTLLKSLRELNFATLSEFEKFNNDYNLELKSVKTSVDLGPRFYDITFFPGNVKFEDGFPYVESINFVWDIQELNGIQWANDYIQNDYFEEILPSGVSREESIMNAIYGND